MPIRYIGKALFPHEEQWQQRRRLKVTFYTLIISVLFAAAVTGIMFWLNSKQ